VQTLLYSKTHICTLQIAKNTIANKPDEHPNQTILTIC